MCTRSKEKKKMKDIEKMKNAHTIRVSISVSIFFVILCRVEPNTGEHLVKKQSSTLLVLPICGPLKTGRVGAAAVAAFSYIR